MVVVKYQDLQKKKKFLRTLQLNVWKQESGLQFSYQWGPAAGLPGELLKVEKNVEGVLQLAGLCQGLGLGQLLVTGCRVINLIRRVLM